MSVNNILESPSSPSSTLITSYFTSFVVGSHRVPSTLSSLNSSFLNLCLQSSSTLNNYPPKDIDVGGRWRRKSVRTEKTG